jgi:hypothetical protein
MEEDQVYLPGDDGQWKAYSITKILEMLKSGECSLSDPAWMDDWEENRTLEDVPGLSKKEDGEPAKGAWKKPSKKLREDEEAPPIVIEMLANSSGFVRANAILLVLVGIVWFFDAFRLLFNRDDHDQWRGIWGLFWSIGICVPAFWLWRSTRRMAQLKRKTERSLTELRQVIEDMDKYWLLMVWITVSNLVIAPFAAALIQATLEFFEPAFR